MMRESFVFQTSGRTHLAAAGDNGDLYFTSAQTPERRTSAWTLEVVKTLEYHFDTRFYCSGFIREHFYAQTRDDHTSIKI